MTSEFQPRKAPVIDLFSRQTLHPGDEQRLVRISPEYDGISMLYGNDANPGKIFKLKLIAWGLQQNGEVVGLVPWLNSVTACPSLSDPLNGHWEGYFNSDNGKVFYDAPSYKTAELQAAYEFYRQNSNQPPINNASDPVIQEIPDQIGTHAVFSDKHQSAFFVTAIFSWQLHLDGHLEGMLVDPEKIQQTPVLAGDDALFAVNTNPGFKYFFQYAIANKIKTQDPDALKAMSALIKF